MFDQDLPIKITEIKLLKDPNFDLRRWALCRTYIYKIIIAKDKADTLILHE